MRSNLVQIGGNLSLIIGIEKCYCLPSLICSLSFQRYLVSPTCQVLRNYPKDRLVHAPAHPLQRRAKPDTVIGVGPIVEADETGLSAARSMTVCANASASGKTPVVGRAKRTGEIRLAVTEDTTATTLDKVIPDHVKPGSVVMTDEYRP